MSKSDSLNEEEFAALIASYKEKFNSLPSDANQLREYALEEGQAVRYGQVRRHWDAFQRKQQQDSDDATPGAEEAEEKSITWEDVWQDYLKVYSNAPKEPIHIFNHAKDMQWNKKYSQAKRAFKRLAKQFGEPEPQKAAPKPRHTKKHSLTEEAFQALLEHYRSKFTYDPKDARMLFSFAVEDLEEHVRYGAVSRAFTRWFRPSPNASYSLLAKPVVREREGTAEPPGEQPGEEAVANEHYRTPSASASAPLGFMDADGSPGAGEAAGTGEESNVVPAIIGAPDDKATHIPQDIFGQLIEKYKSLYSNEPRDARQITTFAADHGYHVRYGAVRRAWSRYQRAG